MQRWKRKMGQRYERKPRHGGSGKPGLGPGGDVAWRTVWRQEERDMGREWGTKSKKGMRDAPSVILRHARYSTPTAAVSSKVAMNDPSTLLAAPVAAACSVHRECKRRFRTEQRDGRAEARSQKPEARG